MMYEQTILHPRHGKTQDKICIFRLLEAFNNVTQKPYHRIFSTSERQFMSVILFIQVQDIIHRITREFYSL
jgi:hypothetical protein